MALLLHFVRPRQPGRPRPTQSASYADLQARRTALINAWTAWLATDPPPDDVAQEIDGTIGAMRGLADLIANGRAPRS